ncbi:MAG TPA: RcnB family protein [Sphingorhabdus sp.]|jgi:Ni/Co efflux regulator RcnB|nr:RcnB family protein [Sphingorhabdus sp.]
MKKRLLITAAAVAATLSPVVAQAQTRELERDRREVREERRELRDAQRYGDRGDVREERREYRDARREYREDWQDYRDRNRNAFRGSRFNAPFRYRSFNSGVAIGASYYAPRYRVSNYSSYRLPQPGRYQTYVRHYNDVLLVNVRTGRVVRAYRGFYW